MVAKFQSLFRIGDYKRYKTTTRFVQQQLAELVPFPVETVSSLQKAADFIHGAVVQNGNKTRRGKGLSLGKRLHKKLIENLEESIALRQLVGATYGEEQNADETHKHMILVLKYCHSKLNAIPSRLLTSE